MKCEQIQPNLLDYSKGLLTGPEAEQVRTHAAKCAACAALLEEETAFARRLASIGEEVPANDVWAMVRIKTKPRRFPVTAWARLLVATPVRRMAAVGVAAVVMAAVLMGPVQQPIQNEPPSRNRVMVKWSDDPLGNHTDAVIDFIDKM